MPPKPKTPCSVLLSLAKMAAPGSEKPPKSKGRARHLPRDFVTSPASSNVARLERSSKGFSA